MEFDIGDLIIAIRLPRRINCFENGDILQIVRKGSDSYYIVKIIYKSNYDEKEFIGVNTWNLLEECKYFDLL